jgi:hypothetical protein
MLVATVWAVGFSIPVLFKVKVPPPTAEDGAVSRHAYAFCVLEQFWRNLKRRDIWAEASTRWRNLQARLLEGEAWAAARDDVLTSLGPPGSPDALLAGHSRTLDAACREVGGRLAASTEVAIDGDGQLGPGRARLADRRDHDAESLR